MYDMASQAIIENLGLEDPEAILSGSLWFQTVPPDIQRKLVNLHGEVLAGMQFLKGPERSIVSFRPHRLLRGVTRRVSSMFLPAMPSQHVP